MARTTVTVDPEHHIPVPQHRLVDAVVAEAGDRAPRVEDLCRLLGAVVHLECRQQIEELKRDYFLFDPAGGEQETEGLSEEEIVEAEQRFLGNFIRMIERANFVPLTQHDLDIANAEDYLFSLPVEVDWDKHDTSLLGTWVDHNPFGHGSGTPPEFARRALLYRRGVGVDSTTGFLFLQKLDLLVWRILFGLVRLPGWLLRVVLGRRRPEKTGELEAGAGESTAGSESIFSSRQVERITLHPGDVGPLSLFQRTRLQEPTFRELVLLYRLEPEYETKERAIHIKTFLDIPMADLEVIFPEKRLSMKPVDLIKVFSTAVTGLVVLAVKLGTLVIVSPLLLAVMLFSLGAYAGRTIVGYRSSRARYRHLVTESLYSKSLDNGLGVVLYLVDRMEMQEWKEMLVAWVVLDRDGPCPRAELDRRCEQWLADRFQIESDFEIADALGKLREHDLVVAEGDRWAARSLEETLERLERKWHSSSGSSGQRMRSD